MKDLDWRARNELLKKQEAEREKEAELKAKREEKKKKKDTAEPKVGEKTHAGSASQGSDATTEDEPSPPALISKRSKSKLVPSDCMLALPPTDKPSVKAKSRADKKKDEAEPPSRDAAKSTGKVQGSKRRADFPAEDLAAKKVARSTASRSVEPISQGNVDAPPPDLTDPYNTPVAAARTISQFCRPRTNPVDHASLEFADVYGEVALRAVKLTKDYQGELHLSKQRYEGAREDANEANRKCEVAEKESADLKAKLKLTEDRIKVLENRVARKDKAIKNATKDWEEA